MQRTTGTVGSSHPFDYATTSTQTALGVEHVTEQLYHPTADSVGQWPIRICCGVIPQRLTP
jgi:hypothetical protein